MRDPMSAEVLRAAARLPNPPARLRRAADAVLEGQFTWEDVAGGGCEHARARALYSPKARQTVWPTLERVARELDDQAERADAGAPAAGAPMSSADDGDFSNRSYLRR
jgi:hypothetical protein